MYCCPATAAAAGATCHPQRSIVVQDRAVQQTARWTAAAEVGKYLTRLWHKIHLMPLPFSQEDVGLSP